MSKITTEVCKNELNQRWVVEGSKSPEDWKRISKTGSVKTSIVRVFQHRSLPLYGTVVEENGTITAVRFTDTLPSVEKKATSARRSRSTTGDTSEGTGASDSPSAVSGTTPAKPASNGKVSADEFLFAVTRREEGLTYFAICRETFWRQHHHLSDEGFGDLLDGLLPKGTGVASECQYVTRLGRKQVRAFLLAQGFKDDERFTQYMGGDED
jgi:hypothetical protein